MTFSVSESPPRQNNYLYYLPGPYTNSPWWHQSKICWTITWEQWLLGSWKTNLIHISRSKLSDSSLKICEELALHSVWLNFSITDDLIFLDSEKISCFIPMSAYNVLTALSTPHFCTRTWTFLLHFLGLIDYHNFVTILALASHEAEPMTKTFGQVVYLGSNPRKLGVHWLRWGKDNNLRMC